MKKKSKIYRAYLAIILLMVYLFSPFKIFAPYITYSINFKYISSTLCENKEKPKMLCNGKCHLKKELKKAAEKESKNKMQINQSLQEELLTEYSFYISKPEPNTENKFFSYTFSYIPFDLGNIFPPPQV